MKGKLKCIHATRALVYGTWEGPLWLKGDVREDQSDILSRGEAMRTVFYGTGR